MAALPSAPASPPTCQQRRPDGHSYNDPRCRAGAAALLAAAAGADGNAPPAVSLRLGVPRFQGSIRLPAGIPAAAAITTAAPAAGITAANRHSLDRWPARAGAHESSHPHAAWPPIPVQAGDADLHCFWPAAGCTKVNDWRRGAAGGARGCCACPQDVPGSVPQLQRVLAGPSRVANVL